MIRFSKILFITTIVLLAFWQLPWLYRFMTAKASTSSFILYSPIIHDFATISHEDGQINYGDVSGNVYDEKKFDAILPTFFVRQLTADNHFPDTINGIPVTPRQIQNENFRFKSAPSEINRPIVSLYYLLESMSGRVDLSMPNDVFRMTNEGIEFIDIESNSVNTQKSDEFTQMMKKKGFKFPMKVIAGNQTTRKEYDEGYLLVDSDNQLFHLKQTKGLPYVRAIDVPSGMKINHLFVTEYPTRKTLAFMTDENNFFYVLKSKTYDIVKVEIPSFNPKKDYITIFGDMFYLTIYTENEQGENYYAVTADDYKLVNQYKLEDSNNNTTNFPLSLRFTDVNDKFVKPRFL